MKAYQKNYELRLRLLTAQGIDIDADDCNVLRRAELTLHRWHEAECNGDIQRDEESDKPFRHWDCGFGSKYREGKYSTPDREKGALARIKEVCERLGLQFYIQGDPRGCALYVSKNPIDDCSYSSTAVHCSVN